MLLKSVAIFWTFLSKFSTKISNFQYSPAKNYIFTFLLVAEDVSALTKAARHGSFLSIFLLKVKNLVNCINVTFISLKREKL